MYSSRVIGAVAKAQSFGEMFDGNLRGVFDVSDSTSDFESFEITTGREMKLVGGRLEEFLGSRGELEFRSDLIGCELAIC